MDFISLQHFDPLKKMIPKSKFVKNMTLKCNIQTTKDMCMSCIHEPERLWHIRYDHLNIRSFSEWRSKNTVYGLPKLNAYTMTCKTYLRGNQADKILYHTCLRDQMMR